MKKTIASLILTLSATAALAAPHRNSPEQSGVSDSSEYAARKLQTICLDVLSPDEEGNIVAASCDSSLNNARFGVKLTKLGCAEGQIVIKTTSASIPSCITPAQL
jgi:hypothetical protein